MTYKDLERRRKYLQEYNRTHFEQRKRIHHRAEWKALGLDVRECERVYDATTACDICGVPFDGKKQKSLDHDHKNKVIRGVLCASCNLALSLMRDDPNLLVRTLEYLEGV